MHSVHSPDPARILRFLAVGAALLAAAAVVSAENLLSNADFESGFGPDGVAREWVGSSTGIDGVFKPNPRLGRIGGGIYGAAHWNEAENAWNDDLATIRLNGKAHLVDASRFDMVTTLQNTVGPEVVTVAKLGAEAYFEQRHRNPLQGDVEANGAEFADYCYERSLADNHWAHCYYGLNEPNVNDADDMRRIARFEKAFTERLHEYGMRSCVLNNSTGTPGDMNNMILPEVKALLEVADYVGYHCYGGPAGFFMCAPQSLTYHSLRWRFYADMYEEREWRFPPVIYTEGTTWWGWHDDHPASAVRDDLLCFSEKMKEDEWAVGLNIFVTGHWPGTAWEKWCVTDYPGMRGENIIIEACRTQNMDNPVDAHGGTAAQEILGTGGVLDMAIGQAARTVPGKTYTLSAWFRHEYTKTWPCPTSIRIGIDPTGQTEGHNRRSVKFGPELIAENGWETDVWYPCRTTFTAEGTSVSVWFRASQSDPDAGIRVYIDDVVLEEGAAPSNSAVSLETF